jgi:hypothetical protein
MNDVKSLLIATTVLAIGGLGLYMYKSEDSDDLYLNDDKFDDEDDDDASDTASETSDASSNIEEEDIDDYYVSKEKNKGTRKNKKTNSGTRKKN